MRENLPVTTTEHEIAEDAIIVSRTDPTGRIVFVNEDFVAASGFSEAELIGAPHNLVRHPDMPKEAFADLWLTLKAGKPWTGAVKNRCKNGDFYWVLASATPVWENGQVTGYMSVRTRLPAEQRAEAERVYALYRKGAAAGYYLAAGVVRRRVFADRFALFTGTFKARLVTLVGASAAIMLTVGAGGIFATCQSNQQLQSVYNDRAVPLSQLFDINNRMQDNILLLHRAAAERKADGIEAAVRDNIAAISHSWAEFGKTALTPELKSVAEAYVGKRRDYVEKGLQAAAPLLSGGKYEELGKHVVGTVKPLFDAAKRDAERLVAIQLGVAKAEYESAQSRYAVMLGLSLAMLLAGVGLGGILGFAAIRSFGRSAEQLVAVMGRIAQGAYNSRVVIERDDEIGVVLRHAQAMQAKLGFDAQAKHKEALEREARGVRIDALLAGFGTSVGEVLGAVAGAAEELNATAQGMAATSEQTARQSSTVAAASEQATQNVQTVATATEELSASIHEISQQVAQSSGMIGNAVQQAGASNQQVQGLTEAAQRIGDVVRLINDIAGQTNLLALNATIEAARAGEAGKGFAVVASEVKALANQTAKATEEIAAQIQAIQAASRQSAESIEEITTTIGKVNETSAAIASAVEQQGAATQEIARNVAQAAQGTGEVSSNIAGVNQAAQQTGAAASQVLASAGELARNGEALKRQVERFLEEVRAA